VHYDLVVGQWLKLGHNKDDDGGAAGTGGICVRKVMEIYVNPLAYL
jgi:hypothetical protein